MKKLVNNPAFWWIFAIVTAVAFIYQNPFGWWWMRGGRSPSTTAMASVAATPALYVLASGFESPKDLSIGTTEEVIVEEGVPTQAYSGPNRPWMPKFIHPGTILRMIFSNGESRDYRDGYFSRDRMPSNVFKIVVFGGRGKMKITISDPY